MATDKTGTWSLGESVLWYTPTSGSDATWSLGESLLLDEYEAESATNQSLVGVQSVAQATAPLGTIKTEQELSGTASVAQATTPLGALKTECIFSGTASVSQATAPLGTLVARGNIRYDDFDRADENPLSKGGHWASAPSGYNSLKVVSNQVQANSNSAWNAQYYTGSFNDYQYSQCEVYSQVYTGPTVRAQSNGAFYVAAVLTTDRVRVFRQTAGGSNDTLVTYSPVTFVSGAVVRIEIDADTNITTYYNGVELGTFDDSANDIGSGAPGIASYAASGSTVIDDWEGGSLGTATNQALVGVQSTSVSRAPLGTIETEQKLSGRDSVAQATAPLGILTSESQVNQILEGVQSLAESFSESGTLNAHKHYALEGVQSVAQATAPLGSLVAGSLVGQVLVGVQSVAESFSETGTLNAHKHYALEGAQSLAESFSEIGILSAHRHYALEGVQSLAESFSDIGTLTTSQSYVSEGVQSVAQATAPLGVLTLGSQVNQVLEGTQSASNALAPLGTIETEQKLSGTRSGSYAVSEPGTIALGVGFVFQGVPSESAAIASDGTLLATQGFPSQGVESVALAFSNLGTLQTEIFQTQAFVGTLSLASAFAMIGTITVVAVSPPTHYPEGYVFPLVSVDVDLSEISITVVID